MLLYRTVWLAPEGRWYTFLCTMFVVLLERLVATFSQYTLYHTVPLMWPEAVQEHLSEVFEIAPLSGV